MTTRVRPSGKAEFGLSLAELTEHLEITGSAPPLPGDLPVELTRLIGRETEVGELAELLVGTRLLTLVGPGGAGKSRLALAVARQCDEGFDGGAWWLDGLPLALELAAARVAVLSASDIAGRLERDPSLLSRSTSIAPARQRTLEATLDWSYNLLAPAEQVLFRRLGAFAGSFSLDDAEAVCGGEPLGEGEIFGLLASLVDQSLVHTVEGGSLTRYRLPPTVARYAAGRLAGSGEEATIWDAHAGCMLRLAGPGSRLTGGEQTEWFDRLALENDNIRAALGRLLPEHPEDGGRLAGMLWPFWYRFGYYDEARRWLDAALALGGAMAPATRAAVLAGSGTLAFLQCDYEPAKARLDAALELYLKLGDRPGGAATLQRLGSIEREQGATRAREPSTSGRWRRGKTSAMRPASPRRSISSRSRPG